MPRPAHPCLAGPSVLPELISKETIRALEVRDPRHAVPHAAGGGGSPP